MQVSEIMTHQVQLLGPDASVRTVAECMAREDIGSVFIEEDDRIVGVVTDRDIVTRAVAQGDWSSTPIRDFMSEQIKYCFADEDAEHVARNMAQQQVRRLPVLDRNKRLIGVVSLANVAHVPDDGIAGGIAIRGVATPHRNG